MLPQFLKDWPLFQDQAYAHYLMDAIPKLRQGKFVQIFIIRETKSHAIFTTEGQILDTERLQSGLANKQPIDRVLLFKRKQIAPERRTGKALLRQYHETDCQLMHEDTCGKCPDCFLYGFAAVKGEGSQKARIMTDSGFSIRSYGTIQKNITLNAIAETTAGGVAGSAFAEKDHLIPQVFFPTVETLVDVTASEFLYVLGNILKTTRYGAESNRTGFVRNHICGIFFADVELFSNLELTQSFYDLLQEKLDKGDLCLDDLKANYSKALDTFLKRASGIVERLEGQRLEEFLGKVIALYQNKPQVDELFKQLWADAAQYEQITKEAKPEKKSKPKKSSKKDE